MPFLAFSQLTGKIQSSETKETVVGAKISASNGAKAISDANGYFQLDVTSYPVTLITSMLSYVNDTTIVNGPGEITIWSGLSDFTFAKSISSLR